MQELHTLPISDELADEAEAQVERKLHSESTLDRLIGGALDEAEKPDEFEDFVAARPYRKELAERHGNDTAGVIEAFGRYSHDIKNNGALAAEKLAGDYFAGTNVAKLLHVTEKQKAEQESKTAKPDNAEEVHWFAKLDKIVEGSIDEADERAKDQAEFATAKEKFAALKAENPHLTWQEFFKTTAHTDRELLRDPNFAYRLAAASGVPATALQVETSIIQTQQQQGLGAIAGLMDEMEKRGELLSLERYAPEMAKLWNRKDFVKTGDTRQDLRRANRIVELLELDRLQNLERQNAVQKAHRAAPVKSSGGMRTAASGRSGSLDSIISGATAHLSDD
jgi:hypothetical protein